MLIVCVFSPVLHEYVYGAVPFGIAVMLAFDALLQAALISKVAVKSA